MCDLFESGCKVKPCIVFHSISYMIAVQIANGFRQKPPLHGQNSSSRTRRWFSAKQKPRKASFSGFQWRRVRDLNPGYAHHAHTISSRAPSTTQPTLHHYLVVCLSATKFIIPRVGQKVKHFFEKFCKKIRTAKNSSGKLLFKRIMPCESDRSSRKRRRRHRSAR